MFQDISIMGRVIYIIYTIECYLKEKEDINEWKILLDALWSFPNYDYCIDEYAHKVIECTPECVLDERENFQTFAHFNEADLCELKKLYEKSTCTRIIDYLMEQINEILAFNLYTTVKPPEAFSLKMINDTYRYIEVLMGEQTPSIEPFEIYSIHERDCWGNYTFGKEELLKNMGKIQEN